MKKYIQYICISFILLFTSNCYSQNTFFTLGNSLVHGYDIRAGFSSISSDGNEFAIFLMDFGHIYASAFDKDYVYLGRINSDRIKRKMSNVFTTHSFGNTHTLFLNNETYKKFEYLEFDFRKHTINSGDIDLNLKGQKIIKSFKYEENLYILSVEKSNPILVLNKIDEDYKVRKKTFDLSNFEIKNNLGKQINLDRLIIKNFSGITGINFNDTNRFPVSLGQTSSKSKIYKQGNKLLITLDQFREFTQVITLNLETEKITFKKIPKPKTYKSPYGSKTNSFIYNSIIAQIAIVKDTVKISVKNHITGKELNAYTLVSGKKIGYINKPPFQKKFGVEKIKELDSKKFIKKLNRNTASININRIDGVNYISFGSWKKNSSIEPNSFSMMYGAAGALLFAVLYEVLSPDMHSFSLYANGQTTQSTGIFDDSFQHLPNKKVMPSLYDNIEEFHKTVKRKSSLLLFNFHDDIIYGLFHAKTNTVELVKF